MRPRTDSGTRLLEQNWESRPAIDFHDYLDPYSNRCRRLTLPDGEATVHYELLAETPGGVDDADFDAPELDAADLPDDVLIYTSPSRYCLSDVLEPVARELFGTTASGYRRVQTISEFVHNHIDYTLGSSTPLSTAVSVFESGTGVCRDFAHLAISLCRALDIPARYTFGYLPDIDARSIYPMDFHAWFEAYLGDRWWTFDPRNNERRKGRIVIGSGRDAVDVAMLTTYGNAALEDLRVWADQVAD